MTIIDPRSLLYRSGQLSPEEAQALATRVVVMARGRQVAEGTVSDMRALVSRKRIECLTSLPLAEIQAWPEVSAATREGASTAITTVEAEAVTRRLLDADPDLAELEVRRAGLSDAFAELTSDTSQEAAR